MHPESTLIQMCRRPVAAQTALRARFALLDWLGCILAARHTDVARAMGRAQNVPDEDIVRAGLMMSGRDAQGAALLLGTPGNVLEMDDLHRASILHPGDAVVAAALAVALRTPCSGPDLLAALTRGYEAAIRIGRVAASGGYTAFYNSGTCGVFGAAIVAADLLKTSEEAMADALGQAGMMASGIWQCRLEPTFSKQLATAHAARAGVFAAELGAAGFPGPRAILTGPLGFFHAYYPQADTAPLTAPGDWALHDMSFKPFPACRHTHPAISAALALREAAAGATPRSITVQTYGAALEFCDTPHPTTAHEARFSLQHTVAVALARGTPSIADFEPAALQAPDLADLRARVRLEVAEDLNDAFPQSYGARVRITFDDGTVQDITCPAAWGDPENPMQDADIINKFRVNAAYGAVPDPQAEGIVTAVLNLPQAADLVALQAAFDAALTPDAETS
ncbi:MAG: MmgE/PrpD family protein [Pseudomonadota bacterium]|nr:MmgE/PrpD family protein [Pseudomonadota bacterium]